VIVLPTNTLLEWDAHIPSFDEVHGKALKAQRVFSNQRKPRGEGEEPAERFSSSA